MQIYIVPQYKFSLWLKIDLNNKSMQNRKLTFLLFTLINFDQLNSPTYIRPKTHARLFCSCNAKIEQFLKIKLIKI